VEALVQLIISSSQDTEVLRQAAGALGNICGVDGDAATHQRAVGAGPLEALVQLISSSSQALQALEAALMALANVCGGDGSHQAAGCICWGCGGAGAAHQEQRPGPRRAGQCSAGVAAHLYQ
jgi:hypothetical protein